MDCSPPGSHVHGIFLARITGVACHVLLQGSRSRESSWLRGRTCVSAVSCLAGRFCTAGPPGKPFGLCDVNLPLCFFSPKCGSSVFYFSSLGGFPVLCFGLSFLPPPASSVLVLHSLRLKYFKWFLFSWLDPEIAAQSVFFWDSSLATDTDNNLIMLQITLPIINVNSTNTSVIIAFLSTQPWLVVFLQVASTILSTSLTWIHLILSKPSELSSSSITLPIF